MARKKKEEPPVEIAVPITPMLDMSFQLLSFFILTYRPMPTEGQLAINLPKVDATDSPPPLEPLPPEDKKDEYTITVHASSGGEIALLSLKGPSRNDEDIKSLSILLDYLQGIPKPPGRGSDAISITIEAANDLNYAKLIQLMDVCKKAGYESVNLMPMRRERG